MHLLSDNISNISPAHRDPRGSCGSTRRRHKSADKRILVEPGPGLGVSLGFSNVSEAQTSKIVNGDSGLHELYSLVVNQRRRPRPSDRGELN